MLPEDCTKGEIKDSRWRSTGHQVPTMQKTRQTTGGKEKEEDKKVEEVQCVWEEERVSNGRGV